MLSLLFGNLTIIYTLKTHPETLFKPNKPVNMAEFSNKILVESVKAYIQLQNQIKSAGYNPYLFSQKEKAKEKVQNQIKLYEAELLQINIKIA